MATGNHGPLPFLPRNAVTSASRWKLRGLALAIGAIVFVSVGMADGLLFDAGLPPFAVMLGSDGVAAVLAAWFSLKLMSEAQERRELVRRRLEIIGEANHNVRNALELIQFSAQTTHNQEVIDNIANAVDRIQWTLRELLGDADQR